MHLRSRSFPPALYTASGSSNLYNDNGISIYTARRAVGVIYMDFSERSARLADVLSRLISDHVASR